MRKASAIPRCPPTIIGASGARERVLDVARRYPQRLRIKLHALATRVLFDDSHRAVGIEYLKGEHLYRADARPDPASGEKREVRARREVILAGGAFNTPQLLMLSGIGPRATLRRHGIPVRVDRSGVGQNLQDRYEISVVNRMAFPHWRALAGARFASDDPLFERWANSTSGMYTSNGAVLSLRLRSEPARSLPDLFLMALMSRFEGYFPGYSRLLPDSLNYLTWVVLKAHTNNCAGEVTLRSADPRDPPLVNFCYFDEGSDTAGHDLRAVVGAIRFVRKVAPRPGALDGSPKRRFRASICNLTTSSPKSCATRHGGITPPVRAQSGQWNETASWTARSASTASRACALSMPRRSRSSPASSRSARST